ncbi:MAG: hydrogenase maturation nickel metallochaperone HypA [Victivallales bacterium]|nr:hydrogenase maturation nickel metallochaperone HypA [Victivallales bacterium]
MHELSLADSMVQEIEAIMEKEGAEKVFSVTVKMGRLSGVEKEPFEFAFPIVAEGTKLEKSKLIIEESPVIVKCKDCMTETVLETPFAKCGNCGSRNVDYISGKEFLIKSLEIE